MKKFTKLIMATGVSALLLGGCANNSPYPSSSSSNSYPPSPSSSTPRYVSAYGVVNSITPIRTDNSSPIGVGTVIGGVVGGLLGNQVGGGNGKTAATAAGVVGGAVVGHQIEKNNNAAGSTAYRIGVRLDNGNYADFTQANIGDLRTGDRVRIDNGVVARY